MHTAVEILIGLALVAITLYLLTRYQAEIDRVILPAPKWMRGFVAFCRRGR